MSDQPTVKDLQRRASELQIEGRSDMDREQLIQAVHDAEEALRAEEATQNAEFPGTTIAPEGTAPQAQSVKATTFADDEYSVEQIVTHPSLTGRKVESSFIRVALRRHDGNRQFWTRQDAQAAVDALLEHPVHSQE